METKVFKFKSNWIIKSDHIYKAETKVEACYLFLQECLGIKLTEFQKKDVMTSLRTTGNPIYDLIECEEVLP